MQRFTSTSIWNIKRVSHAWQAAANNIASDGGVMLNSDEGLYALDWGAGQPAPTLHVNHADAVVVAIFGAARMRPDLPPCADIAGRIARGLSERQAITPLLAELDGEFMLLAWNGQTGTAYAATDPTGHHSLYYASTAGGVAWSSHPFPLARLLGAPQLDHEALNLYFALKGVPAPWSLLAGVRKVQPGHVLCVQRGAFDEREYWPLTARVAQQEPLDLATASEQLVDLLTAAISRYVADADRTVGLFLSGGLDSVALMALARQAGVPLRAFTVGYTPAYHGDETAHARHAAERLGVPIDVCHFSPHDAATLSEQVLPQLAEPVADPTLLPQLWLGRQAASTVHTMLDGTGSDVIFAGTTKYTADPYVDRYQRIPRFVRQGIIEPSARLLPASRRWRLTNLVRRWQFFASGCDLPFDERAVAWTRFLPHATTTQLLSPAWRVDADLGSAYLRDHRDQLDADAITAICFMTLRGHTPWVDLLKLSSLEHQTGLSVRVPYLSPKLVEFGLQLPGALKVRGNQGKVVLRHAVERLIPPGTLQRRKAIFATPISQWISHGLRERFLETVFYPTGLFDTERLRRMVQLNQMGWRDWQSELWAIFVLQHWWIANYQEQPSSRGVLV